MWLKLVVFTRQKYRRIRLSYKTQFFFGYRKIPLFREVLIFVNIHALEPHEFNSSHNILFPEMYETSMNILARSLGISRIAKISETKNREIKDQRKHDFYSIFVDLSLM